MENITYRLWNRQENINGCEPQHFLEETFKEYYGDIILIENNGVITNIEKKDVLAEIYGIEKSLILNDFMEQYFDKINELENKGEN